MSVKETRERKDVDLSKFIIYKDYAIGTDPYQFMLGVVRTNGNTGKPYVNDLSFHANINGLYVALANRLILKHFPDVSVIKAEMDSLKEFINSNRLISLEKV